MASEKQVTTISSTKTRFWKWRFVPACYTIVLIMFFWSLFAGTAGELLRGIFYVLFCHYIFHKHWRMADRVIDQGNSILFERSAESITIITDEID